ncbi:MAG: amidase family protein [bacterium]
MADLAGALQRGELTSTELTTALLERIGQIDAGPGGLQAVLALNPDVAEDAAAADRARAAGVRGPLLGVPVLVKDNVDTAAPLRTTAGSLALADTFAAGDAPIVRALRGAGALVMGKTNLSEWANYRSPRSSSGWSAVGGLTRNPHDRLRSAGGSSSGSGVAVAAGLAPLAIGTETDGSISCPASLCGVVGIKPTVGLVPGAGIVPIAASQDTAGPMARSVYDAAVLLSVLAGSGAVGDTAAGTGTGIDYVAAAEPGRLDGVRIGVPRGSSVFGYHRGADAAALAAIDVLADLGAVIVDDVTFPDVDRLDDAEKVVLDHEIKVGLAEYFARRGGDGPRSLGDVIAFNEASAERELEWFGHEFLLDAEATTGLEAAAYRAAKATYVEVTAELDEARRAARLDAVAMPSFAPAWSIDLVNGDHPVGGCSTLAAISGHPLVSVPCGTVAGPDGPLPVGLALTAGGGTEATLIRIAAAFEAVAGPAPHPAGV